MLKIDLLVEKYLNERDASGVMNPRISHFTPMTPTRSDLKLNVKMAMTTLKGAVKGIQTNLKEFDKDFQRKVVMEALKKLGL
jgi:hypothetical protein